MANSHRPLARVARGEVEAAEVVEVVGAAEVETGDLEVVSVLALVEVLLEAEVLLVAPPEVLMPLTRRPSLLSEHRTPIIA